MKLGNHPEDGAVCQEHVIFHFTARIIYVPLQKWVTQPTQMNQRAQELSSLAVTHANCDLPASRQDRQHLRTCATERGVWQADVWGDQKQLRIA